MISMVRQDIACFRLRKRFHQILPREPAFIYPGIGHNLLPVGATARANQLPKTGKVSKTAVESSFEQRCAKGTDK
jgi:hypothetical protein